MVDFLKIRTVIATGLSEYLGIPVIRSNQSSPVPPFPYIAFTVTTVASANNGTWQRHEDGIDRKLIRSIWSFSSLSDDWDASVSYAMKAREWLEHTGRTYLSENGVIVQSTTAINNRDSILSVEYERKNGFDAVFYLYDEAEAESTTTGYIENVETSHEITE